MATDDVMMSDLMALPVLTYAACLLGFGVISTSTLEQGFRNVDRRFFVPKVSHSV
jgi:hypothetical protein